MSENEDENESGGRPTPPPPGKASFFDAFRDPRLALMVGLGFASGMPNPLTGSTLTAWLASANVSIEAIGLFALVHVPYNLKFIWAPLLDRFAPPFLGRRRGWMVMAQLLVFAGLGALGALDESLDRDPQGMAWTVAVVAMIVAVFSATQDIAVDAHRTDVLPPAQRASGTALFVAGYRFAMIAAGAGALILSDHVPWSVVYLLLGATMALGVVCTLISPEPKDVPAAPRTLRDAVVLPFGDLIRRPRAFSLLFVVMFYKVGDAVAGHLLIPFLLELEFTRTEVGAVLKGLGLAATIAGALMGGGLVAKWGLYRSLLLFGVLQAVANVAYAALAWVGRDPALMTAAIGLDNFLNGLGTAAFVALLMQLCDRRFTATQYALLSALSTLPGRLLGAGAGWLVAASGWPAFFLLTVAMAAPALYFITRLDLSEPEPPSEAQPGSA